MSQNNYFLNLENKIKTDTENKIKSNPLQRC